MLPESEDFTKFRMSIVIFLSVKINITVKFLPKVRGTLNIQISSGPNDKCVMLKVSLIVTNPF